MRDTDITQPPLPGIDPPALPGRFVNADMVIHEQDGLRVALVRGSPFHTWPVGDVVAQNLFVVQARASHVATIEELAAALDRPARTLYLALKQYTGGGAAALTPKRRGRPKGSADLLRDRKIRRLHAGGLLNGTIAKKLGCSPLTVERALQRMGLEPNGRRRKLLFQEAPRDRTLAPEPEVAPEPAPATEPEEEVETTPPLVAEEPASRSLDPDPLDRSLDRFLAQQGVLEDAAPLFAPGENLPWVGVLLAVPALVQSGLLAEARRLYGDIGPAFYGLRTTLMLVVLLSLLRLKRPENLKEFAPASLGRVFGLDRAPEVKTLRRKLHRLADGPSYDLLLAVAQRRANANDEALAWLYVDGHVRVYSGKERLPQAHVTRMRISAPATQEMWVHDGDGHPVLFVTQEAHPSLAKALLPILEEAREVIGDRRITVVFDRGGWSPKLFKKLVGRGIDVLTYRKGKLEPIPADWFEPCPGRPGEPPWLLHDASVLIQDDLWMRQITRLVGQHQTTIVTTRQDLRAELLAWRMFNRWRQENFFKYMREEYDLDGLCEYGAEDEDPLRETPNPDWTRRDKALRMARAAHQALLASTLDRDHPEVVTAAAQEDELRRQRDALPKRVKVGDMQRPPVRLPARVKNLYDGLKTVAWQIETDLAQAVAPFYRRSDDEGRTLITAALRSAGSLQVRDGQLVVTLAAQSSPHRTRAIAELCHLLDQTDTRFPGSDLRLRYRIEGADPAEQPDPTATSDEG